MTNPGEAYAAGLKNFSGEILERSGLPLRFLTHAVFVSCIWQFPPKSNLGKKWIQTFQLRSMLTAGIPVLVGETNLAQPAYFSIASSTSSKFSGLVK